MRTITIEIRNSIALKFLQNLESLNIIRFIKPETIPAKTKLSERFAGCISKEKAEEFQKELNKIREEWERDI